MTKDNELDELAVLCEAVEITPKALVLALTKPVTIEKMCERIGWVPRRAHVIIARLAERGVVVVHSNRDRHEQVTGIGIAVTAHGKDLYRRAQAVA